MSHTIYQTEGIVLNKRDFGEADILVSVFTKEFGKIRASVKGVRQMKSKLRYSLENFSHVRLSLISLNDYWKIIDAEEVSGNREIIASSFKLVLFSKITGLINRMVQGEQEHNDLWNELMGLFFKLKTENLPPEDLKNLEVLTIANMLDALGHLDKSLCTDRRSSICVINKAIKESML